MKKEIDKVARKILTNSVIEKIHKKDFNAARVSFTNLICNGDFDRLRAYRLGHLLERREIEVKYGKAPTFP